MAYIIPSFTELLDGINSVRVEYIEDNKSPNPARLELLDILDATSNLIKHLQSSFLKIDKDEIHAMCLGAYLFCLETINIQYGLLSPEYSEGYIYNSGSKLYKLLLQKLAISDTNKLNDQEKLIYLTKFYNQIFKINNPLFSEILAEKKLAANVVQQKSIDAIKSVFYYVSGEANRLIEAIPTESALTTKMSSMLKDYCEKIKDKSGKDADRKLLAKIGVAFSKMLPAELESEDERKFLSRNERIKIGFYLTLLQSIIDTYWVRHPHGNSELYDLCLEALNINQIDDISPAICMECLSSYKSFAADRKVLDELEKIVNELSEINEPHYYTDVIMEQMSDLAGRMNNQLKQKYSSSYQISYFVIGVAATGAIILSAPGYGAGFALAQIIKKSPTAIILTDAVAKVTSSAMTMVFRNGKYLGYFASNMIVDATIERGFAKGLEAMAMLAGASAGGILAVPFALMFQSLADSIMQHTKSEDTMHPNLAKTVDPRFIECVLTLPPEVFSDAQKIKVKKVTEGVAQVGIFGKPVGTAVTIFDQDTSDDDSFYNPFSMKNYI